jgi:hypothetical protein
MVRELADGRGLMKVSPMTRAILNGEEDLSAWSEEELIRGTRRGKDGRFRKAPKVVPTAVHEELTKRRMSKAHLLLRDSLYDAVALFRQVVNDPEADTSVRVKAAELICDRVLGKAPQSVSVGVEIGPRYAGVVASALVGSVEQARALMEAEAEGDVVEGEIVGEEAS